MRLRHRLVGLFALCAVAPLLLIGALGYSRSQDSLDALVRDQATVHASRIAAVVQARVERLESDVALLSDNAETQALLRARSRGDTAGLSRRRPAFDAYMADLWRTLQFGYEQITIRDIDDDAVVVLSDVPLRDGLTTTSATVSVFRTIRDLEGGAALGNLRLVPRTSDLFPSGALDDGFGARRQNVVLAARPVRVLASGYDGRQTGAPLSLPPMDTIRLGEGRGSMVYEDHGERRIGAWVTLASSGWTVLATASVDEFAGPFVRQRLVDLGLILGVVLVVSVGFFVLVRRATRPLDQLAEAAHRVGAGDLSPELPSAGADEVGHLTRAFHTMANRLREMLAQVEASRQTAVLGQFAVEIAHEIRNPLTSVKLNLQGLERDAREGRIPPESRAAVDMALREIRRLDNALRTSLRVGRPTGAAGAYHVHAVVREAIALLRPEAEGQRVSIECDFGAARDLVWGDPDAAKGVIVNLLLNAIQAVSMAVSLSGEALVLACTRDGVIANDAAFSDTAAIEITIRDSGPGVPIALRDRIFHPFVTTKEQGTGLGLSVALQSVRAMGGTLRLADDGDTGAAFIITLPLAPPGAQA